MNHAALLQPCLPVEDAVAGDAHHLRAAGAAGDASMAAWAVASAGGDGALRGHIAGVALVRRAGLRWLRAAHAVHHTAHHAHAVLGTIVAQAAVCSAAEQALRPRSRLPLRARARLRIRTPAVDDVAPHDGSVRLLHHVLGLLESMHRLLGGTVGRLPPPIQRTLLSRTLSVRGAGGAQRAGAAQRIQLLRQRKVRALSFFARLACGLKRGARLLVLVHQRKDVQLRWQREGTVLANQRLAPRVLHARLHERLRKSLTQVVSRKALAAVGRHARRRVARVLLKVALAAGAAAGVRAVRAAQQAAGRHVLGADPASAQLRRRLRSVSAVASARLRSVGARSRLWALSGDKSRRLARPLRAAAAPLPQRRAPRGRSARRAARRSSAACEAST